MSTDFHRSDRGAENGLIHRSRRRATQAEDAETQGGTLATCNLQLSTVAPRASQFGCGLAAPLLAGFCALALPAAAQTNGSVVRPLSLKDCIQIALEHNLDVKIERYNPEIARFTLSRDYSDYEPVLSGSGTHAWDFSATAADATTSQDSFNSGIGGKLPTGLSYSLNGNVFRTKTTDSVTTKESGGSISLQLAQPLLKNFWTDATRLDIQLDKRSLKISELELRQRIMNTVAAVEMAYYDLQVSQQFVEVQEQALKLAETLVSGNQYRTAQGLQANSDNKQAESQMATRRASLWAARNDCNAQQNVLKGLLSDRISDWQDVTIQPTDEISAPAQIFDRQDSWSRGLTRRPDLLQARLDLERAGFVLKYSYNQLFPQLDVVGSYGFSGSGLEYNAVFGGLRRGSAPAYTYGAILRIPLGNGAARNDYKINKASQQQALLRLQQLEQNVMLQIENSVNLARTMLERVSATRAARQYAEEALKAEQTKFDNGLSTAFFVLLLQRDLTSAQSDEIEAVASYNKARVRLALNEGSILERDHVSVELK